jgi:7-carboxy-7-deazaguanine synthase
MPQPHILKISEIFPSVQGEGLRMGSPSIFVRLAGCNLRCDFCDTRYAWTGGADFTASELLEEIKAVCKNFPCRWICLTGGEPFFQDITALTSRLREKEFRIQIETNGTLFMPAEWDWLTVSPKPPDFFIDPRWIESADEVKLVVTRRLDLNTLSKVRNVLPDKTPLLLQPQSHRRWSMDLGWALLQESLRSGLENIRLSVQLHKVFNLK